MQNNIKNNKANTTIVQDNAKIVQTRMKRAFLDYFAIDFRRLFYRLWQIVRIFAPENKSRENEAEKATNICHLVLYDGRIGNGKRLHSDVTQWEERRHCGRQPFNHRFPLRKDGGDG